MVWPAREIKFDGARISAAAQPEIDNSDLLVGIEKRPVRLMIRDAQQSSAQSRHHLQVEQIIFQYQGFHLTLERFLSKAVGTRIGVDRPLLKKGKAGLGSKGKWEKMGWVSRSRRSDMRLDTLFNLQTGHQFAGILVVDFLKDIIW